jgi:hypothetical protein
LYSRRYFCLSNGEFVTFDLWGLSSPGHRLGTNHPYDSNR